MIRLEAKLKNLYDKLWKSIRISLKRCKTVSD